MRISTFEIDSLSSAPPSVAAFALLGTIALGAFTIWLTWRGDLRIYLGLMLALGVIQVFQPFGYISVALLVGAFALVGVLLRTGLRYWDRWTQLLSALAVFQALALLWSSRPGAVALAVLSTAGLASTYIATREALREGGTLKLPLLFASPLVLTEALLIVLFRTIPDPFRWDYLSSGIARLLSEPEVALLSQGHQDNILDLGKSGGTFLNANIASLFMFTTAALFLWAALRYRSAYFGTVAASAVVGVGFTGSKSPILLPMITGILVAYVLLWARRRWILLSALTLGGTAAAIAVGIVAPQIYAALFGTMDDRWKLWGLAVNRLMTTPVLGMGYGNWAPYSRENFTSLFGPDRPLQALPPHNFFLAAWVDAGLIPALLTLALAVIPIAWATQVLYRTARKGRSFWLPQAVLLIAAYWVPMHGLVDTTGFFGDNHTIPFYAMLIGIIAASCESGRRRQDVGESFPQLSRSA